jgi:hypothetical protein
MSGSPTTKASCTLRADVPDFVPKSLASSDHKTSVPLRDLMTEFDIAVDYKYSGQLPEGWVMLTKSLQCDYMPGGGQRSWRSVDCSDNDLHNIRVSRDTRFRPTLTSLNYLPGKKYTYSTMREDRKSRDLVKCTVAPYFRQILGISYTESGNIEYVRLGPVSVESKSWNRMPSCRWTPMSIKT